MKSRQLRFKICTKCKINKHIRCFYVKRDRPKPRRDSHCRQCVSQAGSKRDKERRAEGPEFQEKKRLYWNTWYLRNALREITRRKITIRSHKLRIIAGYGGKCVCCGDKNFEFLTIDHINGDGKLHRLEVGQSSVYRDLIKRGYPKENYRLLCMNCNFSMGKYGYCPHSGEQP
jgi:hypothetical protein